MIIYYTLHKVILIYNDLYRHTLAAQFNNYNIQILIWKSNVTRYIVNLLLLKVVDVIILIRSLS